MQSGVQSGVIPSLIGPIQDEFNMTSKQAGSIVSCYDIATVFFVTHVGYYCNGYAPRWLGLGMGVMGLGVLVFASSVLIPVNPENSVHAYVLLLFAQIIFGIGASPLYITSPVYLSRNLAQKTFSWIYGLFLATTALGPALGFVFTGLVLGDWDWTDLVLIYGCIAIGLSIPLFFAPIHFKRAEDLTLGHGEEHLHQLQEKNASTLKGLLKPHQNDQEKPKDGSTHEDQADQQQSDPPIDEMKIEVFNISPEEPTESNDDLVDKEKGEQILTTNSQKDLLNVHQPDEKAKTPDLAIVYSKNAVVKCFQILMGPELVHSIWMCLTNPTFVVNNLSICISTAIAGGFTTFASLYLSTIYGVDSSDAAIYVGVCVVPGAVGGTLIGGYVSRRMNATLIQHARFTYVAALLGMCMMWIFFLDDLWIFLGMLVVALVFMFLGYVSGNVITMRCIAPEYRGVGNGIQSVAYRCLGTIPAPIIMGTLFDNTCIKWDGSCKEYDTEKLRLMWFLFAMILSVLNIICCVLQEVFWRRRIKQAGGIEILKLERGVEQEKNLGEKEIEMNPVDNKQQQQEEEEWTTGEGDC